MNMDQSNGGASMAVHSQAREKLGVKVTSLVSVEESIHRRAAAARARRVPGLHNKVCLHVVEEGTMVVLDSAKFEEIPGSIWDLCRRAWLLRGEASTVKAAACAYRLCRGQW